MKSPYGIAVVINIEKFQSERGNSLPERKGSNVDYDKLTAMWRKIGYVVISKKDLKAQEIAAEFEIVANEIKENRYSSFVACIMSHGNHGTICGSDSEPVEIKKIIDLFNSQNCPALCGKPKMFFIQACRTTVKLSLGGQDLDAAECDRKSDEAFRKVNCTKDPDCLIGYSTMPGKPCFDIF